MSTLRSSLIKTALAFTIAGLAQTALATTVVEVETRILPFDPQPGMKSTQVITLDFDKKSAKSDFKTGVTTWGGAEIESIRNNFVVKNLSFDNGKATFSVVGETASGIVFMPNINYSINLIITRSGVVSIDGCHDGYPAYKVTIDGTEAYSFKHESLNLMKLFGDCDVVVK